MSAEGFDGHVEDFELTLGHVTGVRGFLQDGLGRLTGVTYTSVFKPGTNTASCDKCQTKNLDDCTCGYYAYFEQSEYGEFYGGEIGAIVRGYGRTVVGTKGFRAEKADLQALFPIDTVHSSSKPRRRSIFRGLYPTASWLRKRAKAGKNPGMGVLAHLLLMLVLTIVGAFFRPFPEYWASIGMYVTYLVWGLGYIRRGVYADPEPYGKFDALSRSELLRLCRPGKSFKMEKPENPRDTAPFDRLAAIYPDVPIYSSFQEAVAAHPLTPPEEHQLPVPTPENDPDFWDRAGTGKSPSATSGGPIANSLPSISANRAGVIYASGGYCAPAASVYDALADADDDDD